jgi:hypothetical protein
MIRFLILSLFVALALLPSVGRAAAPFFGQCNSSALYDASTNGATQIVALAAGKRIMVCGFSFMVGATATNVSLVYGTGANCATDQVALTPAFQIGVNGGIVNEAPVWNGLATPAGKALCIKTSAGNAVQGLVKYLQQ